MTGRFRKTDLFALFGMILLLLWTPSYLSADDTTRALVDGETFTLPAPRDGDRIVFELVVRETGKDPDVVGPIGMMERRLAEAGEVPRDAVWAEHWTYPSEQWNLSIGSLSVRSQYKTVYYGADGSPVWYAYDAYRRDEAFAPSVRSSGINNDQGDYRYTSDVAYGSINELVETMRSGEDHWVFTTALQHREEVLFGGAGTAGRVLDRFVDVGDSSLSPDEGPVAGMPDQVLLPWEFRNRGHVVFTETPEHFSVEEWQWFHRGSAAAVGYHFGYAARGQEAFLQIDILPRTIERGEGVALPVAPDKADGNIGNDFPRASETPANVSLIPLRDLDQDPRPILDGLSLPVLRTLLEDRSGWSEAFDAGAHIVGFAGQRAPLGTNWTLLLLDEDDRVTIGNVHVAAATGLEVPLVCSDLPGLDQRTCSGRDGINRPFVCHDIHHIRDACPAGDTDPLDLDRSIPDPWALWAQAGSHGMDLQHVALTPEPDVGKLKAGTEVNHFERSLRPLSTERGEVHPHLGYTHIEGADRVPLLRWNLMDGRLDRHTTPLAEDEGPVTLDTGAPEGPIAEVIGIVPVSVATGGLMLLAVSALARSWATLRLFAFAGLAAFYARVQDEDVLDHARRDEIMAVLRAEPGLTATEIAARLKLAWGVTAHHLERLRKAGVVHTQRDGRRRHHFPMELVHPQRVLATRNPDYEQFLKAVAHTPGLSLRDIERQVGRTRSALSRTGSRLVRLGLLEKRRDGMVVRFYPLQKEEE